MAKKPGDSISVDIAKIETHAITFNIVGITPLILNRQSEKAKRMLLMPPLQKNKAERAQTLKHEPFEEFRASPYISRQEPDSPTYLHLPSGMFKKCIAQAAIDVPGASKAQIGRLVSTSSTTINLWGIPYMKADMVRQAGMNKSPDVRFRACLREWATQVTYSYVPSIIAPNSVANLLSAAGVIVGVGDYRVEKGAGDYGQFRIVPESNPEWNRIVANGGRAVQQDALENPLFYDDDTADLVGWFVEELDRRRRTPDIALDLDIEDEDEMKEAAE